MDLHKGRIGVRSEGLGKGSTFYLEFPCLRYTDLVEHEPIHRNISANSSSHLSEYDGIVVMLLVSDEVVVSLRSKAFWIFQATSTLSLS